MTTLLAGASQVVTCRGPARARRGAEMAALDVVDGGAVVIGTEGVILDVGPEADMRRTFPDARVEQVEGVLFPGFVDAHTHAVFGGARLADHERRARGIGYKEIAAQGGGILSSVADVRLPPSVTTTSGGLRMARTGHKRQTTRNGHRGTVCNVLHSRG